jgi:SecA preprotein cross-linking domain
MFVDNKSSVTLLSENFVGSNKIKIVLRLIWYFLCRLDEKQSGPERIINKAERLDAHKYVVLVGEGNNERVIPISKYLKTIVTQTIENPDFSLGEATTEEVKLRLDVWVDSAITALYNYERNREYVVQDNKVKPVDHANTGEIQDNTHYSNGIHQFLQLKEGVELTNENRVTNFISNVGFYRSYSKVYGLTGTIGNENDKSFLQSTYNVVTEYIPPQLDRRLEILPNTAEASSNSFNRGLREKVESLLAEGRPVLVVNEDIKTARYFTNLLREEFSHYRVTPCYDNQTKHNEDRVLAQYEVIVSTNLSGRGTDFKIDNSMEEKGGLHVIVTFIPENTRVLHQAFGRAGRKGQRGSAELFVNIEQEIAKLKVKYSDKVYSFFEALDVSREELSNSEANKTKILQALVKIYESKSAAELQGANEGLKYTTCRDYLFAKFNKLWTDKIGDNDYYYSQKNKPERKEIYKKIRDNLELKKTLEMEWVRFLDQNDESMKQGLAENPKESVAVRKFKEWKVRIRELVSSGTFVNKIELLYLKIIDKLKKNQIQELPRVLERADTIAGKDSAILAYLKGMSCCQEGNINREEALRHFDNASELIDKEAQIVFAMRNLPSARTNFDDIDVILSGLNSMKELTNQARIALLHKKVPCEILENISKTLSSNSNSNQKSIYGQLRKLSEGQKRSSYGEDYFTKIQEAKELIDNIKEKYPSLMKKSDGLLITTGDDEGKKSSITKDINQVIKKLRIYSRANFLNWGLDESEETFKGALNRVITDLEQIKNIVNLSGQPLKGEGKMTFEGNELAVRSLDIQKVFGNNNDVIKYFADQGVEELIVLKEVPSFWTKFGLVAMTLGMLAIGIGLCFVPGGVAFAIPFLVQSAISGYQSYQAIANEKFEGWGPTLIKAGIGLAVGLATAGIFAGINLHGMSQFAEALGIPMIGNVVFNTTFTQGIISGVVAAAANGISWGAYNGIYGGNDDLPTVIQNAAKLQDRLNDIGNDFSQRINDFKELEQEIRDREEREINELLQNIREIARENRVALAVAEEELRRAEAEAERLRAEAERLRAEAERLRIAEAEVERLRAEAEATRLAALAETERLRIVQEERLRAEAEATRLAALAETERLRAEAEATRLAAEVERLAGELETEHLRAEAEVGRLAALAETERLRAEAAEAARLAALAETERLRAEAAEAARLAALAETERLRAEAEATRLAALAETERLRAEAEATRLAALAETERLRAEEAETERLRAALAETERLRAEAEATRLAALAETEHLRNEAAEAERLTEVQLRVKAAEAELKVAEAELKVAEETSIEEAELKVAEATSKVSKCNEKLRNLEASTKGQKIRPIIRLIDEKRKNIDGQIAAILNRIVEDARDQQHTQQRNTNFIAERNNFDYPYTKEDVKNIVDTRPDLLDFRIEYIKLSELKAKTFEEGTRILCEHDGYWTLAIAKTDGIKILNNELDFVDYKGNANYVDYTLNSYKKMWKSAIIAVDNLYSREEKRSYDDGTLLQLKNNFIQEFVITVYQKLEYIITQKVIENSLIKDSEVKEQIESIKLQIKRDRQLEQVFSIYDRRKQQEDKGGKSIISGEQDVDISITKDDICVAFYKDSTFSQDFESYLSGLSFQKDDNHTNEKRSVFIRLHGKSVTYDYSAIEKELDQKTNMPLLFDCILREYKLLPQELRETLKESKRISEQQKELIESVYAHYRPQINEDALIKMLSSKSDEDVKDILEYFSEFKNQIKEGRVFDNIQSNMMEECCLTDPADVDTIISSFQDHLKDKTKVFREWKEKIKTKVNEVKIKQSHNNSNPIIDEPAEDDARLHKSVQELEQEITTAKQEFDNKYELGFNYWYSDDDMNGLGRGLEKYDVDVEKQFKGRLTKDVISSLPEAEDRVDARGDIIKGLEEGKPIFISYNIGGSAATDGGVHWVAIVLVKHNGVINVLYKDSKGDFEGNAAEVERSFREHYGETMQFIRHKGVEQKDGSSCGPMTINNLEIMAKLSKGGVDSLIAAFATIPFTSQHRVPRLRMSHSGITKKPIQPSIYYLQYLTNNAEHILRLVRSLEKDLEQDLKKAVINLEVCKYFDISGVCAEQIEKLTSQVVHYAEQYRLSYISKILLNSGEINELDKLQDTLSQEIINVENLTRSATNKEISVKARINVLLDQASRDLQTASQARTAGDREGSLRKAAINVVVCKELCLVNEIRTEDLNNRADTLRDEIRKYAEEQRCRNIVGILDYTIISNMTAVPQANYSGARLESKRSSISDVQMTTGTLRGFNQPLSAIMFFSGKEIDRSFYEYTIHGIKKILDLRLRTLRGNGVIVLEKQYFYTREVNNIKIIFEDIVPISAQASVILIPVNLYNEHAVGLMMTKQLDGTFKSFYIDPSNESIPDGITQIFNLNGYSIEQIPTEQQKYTNCGSEVIENFVLYLTGERLSQEDAIVNNSRLLEQDLLSNITTNAVIKSDFSNYIEYLGYTTDHQFTANVFNAESIDLYEHENHLCLNPVSTEALEMAKTTIFRTANDMLLGENSGNTADLSFSVD